MGLNCLRVQRSGYLSYEVFFSVDFAILQMIFCMNNFAGSCHARDNKKYERTRRSNKKFDLRVSFVTLLDDL
jgi:hypothetical protein